MTASKKEKVTERANQVELKLNTKLNSSESIRLFDEEQQVAGKTIKIKDTLFRKRFFLDKEKRSKSRMTIALKRIIDDITARRILTPSGSILKI